MSALQPGANAGRLFGTCSAIWQWSALGRFQPVDYCRSRSTGNERIAFTKVSCDLFALSRIASTTCGPSKVSRRIRVTNDSVSCSRSASSVIVASSPDESIRFQRTCFRSRASSPFPIGAAFDFTRPRRNREGPRLTGRPGSWAAHPRTSLLWPALSPRTHRCSCRTLRASAHRSGTRPHAGDLRV
jgi:hypothetical protein